MATYRTISGFKERLAGGGARSNLFEVSIPSFPDDLQSFWRSGDNNEIKTFNFLCKTASLPASNIASIDVPFRGRIMKVAGDRTVDPWQVTIINDENFKLRTAFERWMNAISKLDNNTGITNPGSYMTDAYVYQLGRGARAGAESKSNRLGSEVDRDNGAQVEPLRTYKFYDIFPTNVSEIELSYDSDNSIEEFTVEFQVQWWSAGEDNSDQNGDVVV